MAKIKYNDLTTRQSETVALSGATGQPVTAGQGAGPKIPSDGAGEPASSLAPQERVRTSWLVLNTIANFGVSLAFIVPLSYSLAVRVSELLPGHEEVLGYVTGFAQIIYLVLSPLIGLLSDRTRSRFGRRVPYMVAGALLGLVALAAIAAAPSVFLVGVGWVFGLLGWATAGQAVQNLQADRVPEEQRGRISALSGISAQIAPVLGIGVAYSVASSTFLVFVVPGVVGFILMMLFPIFIRQTSSKNLVVPGQVTVKSLFSSYGFNPRKHPDFGWNWLGRFVFFMGLYFNTTFGTFFYAQRLDLPVKEVAGTVAIIGLLGVAAATVAAFVGGYLSDKFRRRKLFTLLGALFFVAGGVVEAFAHSFPTLVIGGVLMQLAIALFAAVDQAIVFAVLPDRSQVGRYMAVVAFAQKIPSAIAPLIAPAIILIGANGADKNYTVLYLAGAALALIGGLIVVAKVKSVR